MARKRTAPKTEGTPKPEEAAKTEETPKTKPTAKAAEKTAEEKRVVYIGADLPGIKSGTVLSGEIPEILKKPYIRDLAVPVEELPNALKKKNITESRIAFAYRKSAEYAASLRK